LWYLPGLLNNNRFLILSWVRIQNLASHTLALALRRVSFDWKSQYGVEPSLVETFVDGDWYKGVCYRAANWTYLGTTKLKMINSIPIYYPDILKEIGVMNLTLESYQQMLVTHFMPFLPFFRRKEHHPHFVNMIKGLLSDLERKSIEPIALAFAGDDQVRNMANFHD
jgi:hypothetical protein